MNRIILVLCLVLSLLFAACKMPGNSGYSNPDLENGDKMEWKECKISENEIDLDWSYFSGTKIYRVYSLVKETDKAEIKEIMENGEYFETDVSDISLITTDAGYQFFYVTAIGYDDKVIKEIGNYKCFYYDPSFDWDLNKSIQNDSELSLVWTPSSGANVYYLFACSCNDNENLTYEEIIENGEEIKLTDTSYKYQITEPDKKYYFVIASAYDYGDDEIFLLFANQNLIYANSVSSEKLNKFEWNGYSQEDWMVFKWTQCKPAQYYMVYHTIGPASLLDEFNKNYSKYSNYKIEQTLIPGIRINYFSRYDEYVFCKVIAFDKNDNPLSELDTMRVYIEKPIPQENPKPGKIGRINSLRLKMTNSTLGYVKVTWSSYSGAAYYMVYCDDTHRDIPPSADKIISLAGDTIYNKKQKTTSTSATVNLSIKGGYGHFVVQAFDADGNVIAQSGVESIAYF